MICSGVPQPWLGRCWNRPNESWLLPSPRSPRLRSDDSCSAVATAMIRPRGGMPRPAPTETMRAALVSCSLSYPDTGAEVAAPDAVPDGSRRGVQAEAPPARPMSPPTQSTAMPTTAATSMVAARPVMVGRRGGVWRWCPRVVSVGADQLCQPHGWWDRGVEQPGGADAADPLDLPHGDAVVAGELFGVDVGVGGQFGPQFPPPVVCVLAGRHPAQHVGRRHRRRDDRRRYSAEFGAAVGDVGHPVSCGRG